MPIEIGYVTLGQVMVELKQTAQLKNFLQM